jgi:hypothetical protein
MGGPEGCQKRATIGRTIAAELCVFPGIFVKICKWRLAIRRMRTNKSSFLMTFVAVRGESNGTTVPAAPSLFAARMVLGPIH